jgi:hypothetical protein
LIITEEEFLKIEDKFVTDTPYKRILRRTINKDNGTMKAIYLLLRMELVHQTSSMIRLFYDGLITIKYISINPEERSELFWGYADIEEYEISRAFVEWEKESAKPEDIKDLEKIIEGNTAKYEELKEKYTFTDKNGRTRSYINWCNKPIAAQAEEIGPEYERLYRLGFSLLSSYVHGSPWSLRRQPYSRGC